MGKAEVGDANLVQVFQQDNIRRLDISMDGPLFVSGLQALSNLCPDSGDACGCQLAKTVEPLPQRLTLDQLHDDPRDTSGFLNPVHRDHVGMHDTRRRLSFLS